MTRKESKKKTIKKIGMATTGKEVTQAMLEHFKKYAATETRLQEAAVIFSSGVLLKETQSLDI